MGGQKRALRSSRESICGRGQWAWLIIPSQGGGRMHQVPKLSAPDIPYCNTGSGNGEMGERECFPNTHCLFGCQIGRA